MWKSRLSQEKFEHSMGERRAWVWTHELGNRNGLTHHIALLNKEEQLKANRKLSRLPWISPTGKMESVWMILHSSAVWSAQRPISLSLHPEYLILSYLTGSYEEAMKLVDRTILQSFEGRLDSLTALQTPLEHSVKSCWICLTSLSLWML